jgi:hypothetical protein
MKRDSLDKLLRDWAGGQAPDEARLRGLAGRISADLAGRRLLVPDDGTAWAPHPPLWRRLAHAALGAAAALLIGGGALLLLGKRPSPDSGPSTRRIAATTESEVQARAHPSHRTEEDRVDAGRGSETEAKGPTPAKAGEAQGLRRGRAWGPEQATGAPDTLEAGDTPTAWASLQPHAGPEWLKLEYEKEVEVAEVRVRVTHNPGAITKVAAFDKGGKEELLWQGREPQHEFPGDFVVFVPNGRRVLSKSVKVHLDTALVPDWSEIDAVRLVARDGTGQWAAEATASSTFAERGVAAEDAGQLAAKTVERPAFAQPGVATEGAAQWAGKPGPQLPLEERVEAEPGQAVYNARLGGRGGADPGDPFKGLADAPVRVKLRSAEVIDGVLERSQGDFIVIRQPAARKRLFVSKQQIAVVEAVAP